MLTEVNILEKYDQLSIKCLSQNCITLELKKVLVHLGSDVDVNWRKLRPI